LSAIRPVQRRPLVGLDALPADMHPLLRRVYAARNVRSARELDYSLDNLLPFDGPGGIDRAAELLAGYIEDGRRIIVIADYDADGATACALAVRALRAMGAAGVDYLVPDRFRHGYGLSLELVELAAASKPDVLVTVDNGISSVEGVARARALGIDVIVTDHHLPGPVLPEAAAIVNPNLAGDPFPGKSLSGVGVMFYVLAVLRATLRGRGWFAARSIEEPRLAELLDLVALGTVADMVPLDANNRILVAQGLKRVRAGRGNPGVAALLRAANRNPARATAADFGFFAGPRLNAAGRLTDMRLGIECLLADDPGAAARMAAELDALNRERRQIQAGMQEQSLAAIAEHELAGDAAALCLYNESWHGGVVGILASQIKERVQRPVFAFAPDSDGLLRGSGRSVEGVHLRDAVANVAARHPRLIRRFGGHAMAVGMTLERAMLDEFSSLIGAEIGRLAPDREAAALLTDGELDPGAISIETAELLREAGPWGRDFPEPLWEGEFGVAGAATVGGRHLKLRLDAPGRAVDAIAFNQGGARELDGATRVRLAYRLDVNEFRGRAAVQLLVEQFEAIG
jgi:single-stranded-DNA-specific exonuclease